MVSKIANQVDIEFNASVNDEQIDELLKKLQKIESAGVIDLKSAKKEINDLQKEIKKVNDLKSKKGKVNNSAKEQEKINKNIIEQERAKQQIIAAQNKGLVESEKLARNYLKTLENGGEVTQKQWARLKTISELEKQRLATQEAQAEVRAKQETKTTKINTKSEEERILALNTTIKNAHQKRAEEQIKADKLVAQEKNKLQKEEELRILQLNSTIKKAQEESISAQKKVNNIIKEQMDLKDKEEAQLEKQIKLEQDRLNKIEELRRKVGKSDLGKDDRANVTKGLYILEKRLSSENWDNEYKLAKENFNDRVKFLKQYTALSEKEIKEKAILEKKENKRISNLKEKQALKLNAMQFEKSPELQRMAKMYEEESRLAKEQQNLINKKHNEALAMDKARTSEKIAMEKAHSNAIIENKKREVSKTKQLEKIKLSLIKTNLDKQYGEELELLEKKKNISQKEINDFKKKVDTKIATQQGARANFTEDISNLMFYRQVGNYVVRTAQQFEKFEDSLYQTGIVAGRSAMEIREMRNEVLELGLDIPRATQDILDNITAIQRTGRSYEEASQIIKKSAKLAVASGESIALSTDVLNKALIAFNINVAETSKVMNMFHSASIKSPLDLKKISDGLKNSASSMRNFIESTNKSGKELEDYKMRVLSMNTAMLSGMSALGRQASSSGMSIRTLGTKLTKLEVSAKKLLDTELALNSVMIKGDKIVRDGSEGFQLTSNYITQLAENDLPRAIELLSELYKTGEVSTKTLMKMFTNRQGSYLIAQLGLMNGSMDNYINRFTKGYEVTEDYEQAIQSWSSEMKKARNSMMMLNSSVSGFMDNIGSKVLSVFNSLVSSMNDLINSSDRLALSLGVLKDVLFTLAFAGLAKNLTMLTLKFTGIKMATDAAGKSLGLFKTISASIKAHPIMALLSVLTAVGVALYSLNKRRNDQLILEENKRKRINKELNQSLDLLGMQLTILENQKRTMEDLVSYDLTKNFDGTYDILDRIVEKMGELVKMLEITSKLKTFQMPELKSFDALSSESFATIGEKYEKELEDLRASNPEFIKAIEERDKKIAQTRQRLNSYERRGINAEYVKNNKLIFESKQSHLKRIREQEIIDKKLAIDREQEFLREKERINKEYQEKELKLIKSYSKLYEATLLKETKVKEPFVRGEGVSLFDIINKNDAETSINILKHYKEEGKISNEILQAGITLIKEKTKIENENLEKVNKSMIEYINNLEQVNKFIIGQKVEIFDKFVKSEDIKSVSQYSQAMQKFGIISKGTTNEMTELEDSMKKLGVSTSIQDLFKTGKLMKTVTMFKSLNTSIEDMEMSITNFDNKLKKANITEEQKEIYETGKLNAETTKENLKALLDMFVKGIDYQEKSNEKLTFYYDMTKKLSLEAQQVGLEELKLLQNKRDILSEEMKISKAKYEFDKKAATGIIDQTKRTIAEIKKGLMVRQEGATDEEELKRVIAANKEIERLTKKQIKLESLVNNTSLKNLLIEKQKYETKLENKEIIAGSEEEDYLKLLTSLIQIETQRQQELNDEKKKGLEYTADEVAIMKARKKAFDDYISNLEKLKTTTETMQDLEKKLGGRGRLQIESEINKEIKAQAIRRKNNLKINEKGSKEKLKNLAQELKDADALEKMYERMGEISFEKQNLNKSTLDNLKSEQNYLEYSKSIETDKLKIAELDLKLAQNSKAIAQEENKILLDRIGIVSNLVSKFGEMGGLFGGAISGIGGLFQEDSKTGLNAFQTMLKGGSAGLFSGLGIGMTAFDIANSFWSHSEAKKEEARQEYQRKLDEERNKILKSQNNVLGKSISSLDVRGFGSSIINSLKREGQQEFKGIVQGKTNFMGWTTERDTEMTFKVDYTSLDSFENLDTFKEEQYQNFKNKFKTLEGSSKEAYNKAYNNFVKYMNDMEVYFTNKQEIFSTLFGFNIESVEDDEGKIIDYVTTGWSKASDIIKKIQGDALEGVNEINSYLGTDFVTMTSNALISNNKNIGDSVNSLEEKYSNFSMRVLAYFKEGKSVEDTFKNHEDLMMNLEGIVKEAEILEAEQEKINEDAEYLKQLWMDAGGAIADMDDALSEMDNSILDILAQGLISKDTETMVQGFGDLISTTLTEKLRDSNLVNKPFEILGGAVKDIMNIELTDFELFGRGGRNAYAKELDNFEELYRTIIEGTKELDAEKLTSLGFSAKEIQQLKLQQEIYERINKVAEDSLNLWEKRDKLIEKANKTFKDTITSVSDIYVNSKLTSELWSNELLQGVQKVKEDIKEANSLTRIIDSNSKAFLKTWIDDGNKMSDIIDMMTENMQSLYNSTLEFLDSKNYAEASSKLGSDLAGNLIESYQKELLDEKYANQFMILSNKFGNALASGSLNSIQSLNNEIQKFAVATEQERLRFDAIKDLFSIDNQMSYNQSDQNITYETGSTKSNVYNYYNTVDITGTFIANKSSVRKLTEEIVKYLPESMKNNNIRT